MTYSMPVTQKLRKLIKSLYLKQHREQNGLFIAEGEKVVAELLKSDYDIELGVFRESPSKSAIVLIEQIAERGVQIFSAPKHIFDQMCDAKTPQSILAVTNIKSQSIIKGESFIALDAVADPGNVGTIIRTADWFGFKQVILNTECADKLNPKCLRSTMGSIFKIQVVQTNDMYSLIKEEFKGYSIYGADAHAEKSIKSFHPKKNFGLVFGSESHGISPAIAELVDKTFRIDGLGSAESLNVSIAAGISLYHFSNDKI
ncbi:MAG: RNA methyltransferase [bacterium]